MCVVCGCSGGAETPKAAGAAATAGHSEVQVDPSTGDLHYGAGSARVSVPGLSPQRAIKLEADVLGENNRLAAHNREHFIAHGITALNLVSSPGSGKTTLLCATIEALRRRHASLPVAVIEGDQQTSFDADRIRATGAPAIQVNTGKGCHLDAQMVADAWARLPLHAQAHAHHDDHSHHGHHGHHGHHHDHDHHHGHHRADHAHDHAHDHTHDAAHRPLPEGVLFIENVGNLVCPAMWDLGEAAKVAVLSVTEGEDKPLKYPDMFAAAQLMVLNKVDLLPHLSFDVDRCIAYARRVNPAIEVLQVSATRGEGLDAFVDWVLGAGVAQPGTPFTATAAGARETELAARVAELERELAEARAQLAR